MDTQESKSIIVFAVITAALGFFVDAYDLLLYSIVRNKSLISVGLSGDDLLNTGIDLLNAQLIGMLIGGIIWGVLGDIYGRRSVLFGSIILYSSSTLLNGFADTVFFYGVCRFIAGIGLSGELGAGITLVSELMSKKNRGYGTMIVAAVGVLGVVTGSIIGERFPWRVSYFIGGILGFVLLLLRLGVKESAIFSHLRKTPVSRGNFFSLFTSLKRFKKYACLILLAMPIWYAIGILITFSPEIGKSLGLVSLPKAGTAIMLYYLGLTIGDLTNGFLSQVFKSRKKIIFVFMVLTVLFCAIYFLMGAISLSFFYTICFLIGWSSGYWAVFVTVAAEQFGTNLRATVAVTAPNFVRGLTALLTSAFKNMMPETGTVQSAALIGIFIITIAFIAFFQLEETYGKDLDYVEEY